MLFLLTYKFFQLTNLSQALQCHISEHGHIQELPKKKRTKSKELQRYVHLLKYEVKII